VCPSVKDTLINISHFCEDTIATALERNAQAEAMASQAHALAGPQSKVVKRAIGKVTVLPFIEFCRELEMP
jgi:hypothetical protein